MSILSLATPLLVALNTFLGVAQVDPSVLADWSVVSPWVESNGQFIFKASSEKLVTLCKANEDGKIIFPRVIHGTHEIFLDEHLVFSQKSVAPGASNSFYDQPSVSCASLSQGKTIFWTISSYSKYFSRLGQNPFLYKGFSVQQFFNVQSNVVAVGILIFQGLLGLLFFVGRVSHIKSFSVFLGTISIAGYFLFSVAPIFGVAISILSAHKIADICLWTGGFLFMLTFVAEGLVSQRAMYFFGLSCIVGISIILLGNGGDQVQVGTLIPLVPYLWCSLTALVSTAKEAFAAKSTQHFVTRFLSIAVFFGCGLNDAFNVFGLLESPLLLSVGVPFGFFGLSVAVNMDIDKTYQERDLLVTTLEARVDEKTKHLQQAMTDLQLTQAELVQSAKLASLGTLSAGVAHEINNSINYVNGALKPLEKKLVSILSEKDLVPIQKLLGVIREGTDLTVNIVKSLRTYTGLNHSSFKEFSLREVVESTLTILKSPLRGIVVDVNVPADLAISGSIVGFSQIMMNLITNAKDALPKENGAISISAMVVGDQIEIKVKDNGSGMSAEVQRKIFDPFFTTKDVGHGTGLGLHIVIQEVAKHRGQISVSSTVGLGTEFKIVLPRKVESLAVAS
jgi:signal transduction histidine kinase